MKRWTVDKKMIYDLNHQLNSVANICRFYCNREARDAILLLEGRFHLMIRELNDVPNLDQYLGRLIKLLMVKNRGDPDLWADTLSKFLAFIVQQFEKAAKNAERLEEPEAEQERGKLAKLKKQMSNDLVLALW